jgi:hypothetical protein
MTCVRVNVIAIRCRYKATWHGHLEASIVAILRALRALDRRCPQFYPQVRGRLFGIGKPIFLHYTHIQGTVYYYVRVE